MSNDNSKVSSKSTKRYGRNPSGDVRGSTGEQPASIYRSQIPGAMPSRTVGGPGTIKAQTVGWVNGVEHAVSFPNSTAHKHTGHVLEQTPAGGDMLEKGSRK